MQGSCRELKLSRKRVNMAEEEKLFSRVLTKEASFQSSSSELKLPRKSVNMAEEEKVFSRVLTKEASMAESYNSSNSFRVYYGGVSAGVPFRWESQPGTPKHKFSDNSIPPLTPPPSYYCTRNSHKSTQKTSTKLNLLRLLFPKLSTSPKKLYVMSKSSFYSVSPSSSSRVSSCSSPTAFMSPKFQYGEKGGAVGSESKNLFWRFVGSFLSPAALPNGECQECIEVHSWPCLSPACF